VESTRECRPDGGYVMRWPRYQFRLRTFLVLIMIIAGGLVVVRWTRSQPAAIGPHPAWFSVGPPVPAWLVPWLDRQGPPTDRLRHFAWLGRESPTVRIVGWRRWLVSESPIPGGRVVKIGVAPQLRGGGVPFTPDTFCESYEDRHGKIRYLGGQNLSNRRGLLID
jgi:hypothetical protein